jgi:endonuclease YncB( thermonuclease family)
MKRLALIVLLLALGPLPALAADFAAKVVGVSDGDTLTVLTAEKRQVKVRLHGIDAPETGQDFGSRAKQAASEMAFGQQVTVRELDKDRYGRTVAEVILPDGRSLNREMVRGGMAWWYRQYAPADRELASLEAEARAAKRGLWTQPGAVPPWDWRSGKGVPAAAGVVGNRRSHLYHAPNCRGAAATSEKNRVAFKTAAEAEASGYRKAGDCRW